MSASSIYLITGANRGIGRGLTEAFASRPNTTVIAAVRDPAAKSSKELETLGKELKNGSKIIIVKISATSETEAREAVKSLQDEHAIDHLDVVIANAGISDVYQNASVVDLNKVREHWEVNTLGPLILFQAVLPLLSKSALPKFVVISTIAAAIGLPQFPMPLSGYGSSKAAINFITRQIHHEHPNLIAFPIHPGWVQTEMGNAGAKAAGIPEAPVTLKDSIDGLTKQIDASTRENAGGQFLSFDGEKLPW